MFLLFLFKALHHKFYFHFSRRLLQHPLRCCSPHVIPQIILHMTPFHTSINLISFHSLFFSYYNIFVLLFPTTFCVLQFCLETITYEFYHKLWLLKWQGVSQDSLTSIALAAHGQFRELLCTVTYLFSCPVFFFSVFQTPNNLLISKDLFKILNLII